MLRCLHLSDLHLGWSAGFLAEQAGEYERWRDGLLHRVVDWALQPEQGIDLVLLVGDLFDTHHPAGRLVEGVLADLRALVAAGKTVITVPGNHDEITYHDSVYQRQREHWPGTLVVNPLPTTPLRLSIAGEAVFLYSLAYTGGLTRLADGWLAPAPRASADGIHLGAFHGSLDWAGEERALPLSSEQLAAAGYDYVALGHFHRPQQLCKGKTMIAYAGSLESKGFSDPGCGQLQLAELAPGWVRTSTVPWPTRPHRVEQIDLDWLEDEQALDQRLADWSDRSLLLRVELVGGAGWSFDGERLLDRHRSDFFHLEVSDDGVYLADQVLRGWAEEATVRGSFVRRLLLQLEQSAQPDQRRLLQLALRRGVAAFRTGGDA